MSIYDFKAKVEKLKEQAATVPKRLAACVKMSETDSQLLYDLLEKLGKED